MDEEVRGTGVAGTSYDAKGQLVGSLVFVDGPTNLVRVAEPPAPSSLAVRSSQELFGYVPPGQQGHRAKYQGTVLLSWPEGCMIMRDQEGAVQVHKRGTPAAKPGDTAEALGFRAADADGNYLDDSTVHNTGTATLSPIRFSVAGVEEFTNRLGGDIVRLEGTLLKAVSERGGRHRLELWDGKNLVRAWAPAVTSVPASALGSLVSISGVLLSGDRGNSVPELWLPEASDMKILGHPSNTSSPLPLWWILLSSTLGLLAGEVLWRNRRRKPASLHNLPPPIFAPNHPVSSLDGMPGGLSEERQRIARDLHDGVIQSLYAIGLGLEDCKTAAGGNRVENLERRLQKTVNDLLKEINCSNLLGTIEQVLNGQSILDPGITRTVVEALRHGETEKSREKSPPLSSQEMKVLALVAQGKTNREIGEALQLSEKTVKNYFSNILAKLDLSRRSQAAAFYVKNFA